MKLRYATVPAVLLLVHAAGSVSAQQPSAKPAPDVLKDAPKTAVQQFKNIQVLKDIPADQLIPSMQFIAGSLGVNCDFCHVDHNSMDKDDKKEKQTARKMISMVLAIDKNHFDGELRVTCYTCHRGSPHPVSTPVLSLQPAAMAPHTHEHHPEETAHLPAADQVFDKYLAAVGGADALHKIRTRVQSGKIDAFGGQFPVEVYSQAPDKRVSITHPPMGESVTAFNGSVGWLSIPGGVHFMSPAEREAARIDAELYFPARIRELYNEFHVLPGEELEGRATTVVAAAAPGRPSLRLYFDSENGLLLRLLRFAETPLGRNPTQIDYADYRETDGLRIPYRWTVTRTGTSFTIHIDKVQQNVPIDENRFTAPPAHPGP
ncbi:MAG TPA: c-type cytochrome [Candidatus Acidoferrum sp.]